LTATIKPETSFRKISVQQIIVNPSNAELNPVYHLLALLGAHHILQASRMRVKIKKIKTGKKN